MNAYLDDLARRLAAAADRRGVSIAAPTLSGELSAELLELARVVAHASERRFAPLSTFLAGEAVAALRASRPDLDDTTLVALLADVREELERP